MEGRLNSQEVMEQKTQQPRGDGQGRFNNLEVLEGRLNSQEVMAGRLNSQEVMGRRLNSLEVMVREDSTAKR